MLISNCTYSLALVVHWAFLGFRMLSCLHLFVLHASSWASPFPPFIVIHHVSFCLVMAFFLVLTSLSHWAFLGSYMLFCCRLFVGSPVIMGFSIPSCCCHSSGQFLSYRCYSLHWFFWVGTDCEKSVDKSVLLTTNF